MNIQEINKAFEKYKQICKLFEKRGLNYCEFVKLSEKQQKKGIKKYGIDLVGANLSNNVLLNHATEEIIDLINYFSNMD